MLPTTTSTTTTRTPANKLAAGSYPPQGVKRANSDLLGKNPSSSQVALEGDAVVSNFGNIFVAGG